MDNVTQVGGTHYAPKSVCPSCGSGIQHWDYAAGLPYLDAQISKYVDRHNDKGGFQDLLKSLSYLVKAMQVYYPEEYAKWRLTSSVNIVDCETVDPDVDVVSEMTNRHILSKREKIGAE